MPAMNRHRSIPSGVVWNAMMKAPTEYQSSAKVKIERRPKRSESQLKASVPTNNPENSAAMKLAKPCGSKMLAVGDGGLKSPVLNNPIAT